MTNLFHSEEIIAQAKEKINKEFETLGNIGKKEQAVSSYVHNILCDACDQSAEFASVIYMFKRSLKDCLVSIMKNTGNAVSDIDVYRSAIQFYFPNSEINCTTTITLMGEGPSEKEISKASTIKSEDAGKKNKSAKEQKKPDKPKKKEDDSVIQLSLF